MGLPFQGLILISCYFYCISPFVSETLPLVYGTRCFWIICIWTSCFWNTCFWNTCFWNTCFWNTCFWNTCFFDIDQLLFVLRTLVSAGVDTKAPQNIFLNTFFLFFCFYHPLAWCRLDWIMLML